MVYYVYERAVGASCAKTLSYKAITCPTNPEDVNQFICCGRDNKAYFADQQYAETDL